MNIETIAIHGGQTPDKDTNSRACPIYQTTAYTFDDTQHASDLFELKKAGNIYTRLMNPTTDVLEQRMALLEGGVGALAVSSGMSAILATVLTLAKNGDEIISSSAVYGGTHTLFTHTLEKFGIKTIFINSDDPKEFESAITSKTKLIFGETVANPKLNVFDIEGVAQIAHKHGIPLVIDSTVTTPCLLRPIEFGADIVVHSATKYLGGHGNSMGGIIVDSGKFDWAKSGRFECFTEPDESYHGIIYNETFGAAAFIAKARTSILRDMGFCISPFNSFMILQGVETLALRMERHCENTLKVAEFLRENKNVSWLNYPAFSDCKNAKKYLKNGFGGMLGFGIAGANPKEAGAKFIDSAKLLSHVANIGDTRSLVIHPASTTHQQLSDDEKVKSGVSDDYIRLSIGIENADDIIADIKQALEIACG